MSSRGSGRADHHPRRPKRQERSSTVSMAMCRRRPPSCRRSCRTGEVRISRSRSGSWTGRCSTWGSRGGRGRPSGRKGLPRNSSRCRGRVPRPAGVVPRPARAFPPPAASDPRPAGLRSQPTPHRRSASVGPAMPGVRTTGRLSRGSASWPCSRRPSAPLPPFVRRRLPRDGADPRLVRPRPRFVVGARTTPGPRTGRQHRPAHRADRRQGRTWLTATLDHAVRPVGGDVETIGSAEGMLAAFVRTSIGDLQAAGGRRELTSRHLTSIAADRRAICGGSAGHLWRIGGPFVADRRV
jgi:hypothetical protein